jgi:hypothetical protein
MSSKPIWEYSAFAHMFCDPFIEGTELEGISGPAMSLALCAYLMGRLLKQSSRWLSLFSETDLHQLREVHGLVYDSLTLCAKASKIEKPEELQELLQEWQATIEQLDEGQLIMLPGGWRGLTASNTVIYLVTRTSPDHFAFVICNAGEGLDYHPASAHCPPKIKYKTCLR